jgi:hypothetical protein
LSTLSALGLSMRIYGYIPILILLMFLILLTACGGLNGRTSVSSTPTPDFNLTSLPPPVATVIPESTDTAFPQITPAPASTRVVLLAPDHIADLYLYENVINALDHLTSLDGLTLEVHASLLLEQLDESISLVVTLPPDPGLANLVNNAPQTRFLAIGIPGLQPTSNLSVIPAIEDSIDEVAFLAGYIAAVVTPDWRVGVISGGDTTSEIIARSSFQNGAIFFCGLCQLSHPPYHPYPLFAAIDSDSGEVAWRLAADDLISRAVRTVYVTPGVENEPLLAYLAGEGLKIIGFGPPPEAVRDQWIASVRVNYEQVLADAWSDLLSADSGLDLTLPLAIEDINQELFTPGRQMLVETILPDLVNGYIDTGASPHSGQDN